MKILLVVIYSPSCHSNLICLLFLVVENKIRKKILLFYMQLMNMDMEL